MSQQHFAKAGRILTYGSLLVSCLMLVICSVALAQQGKNGTAKANSTGRYEGTAQNKAQDVITVTLDLTEKEGALSGEIQSSHGNFTITGGSRKGDAVTLDFDAGGSPGTLSLHMTEDKLVGTWSAGDDGGPVEVKRASATQAGGAKGKS
jgi:hypothetical protein